MNAGARLPWRFSLRWAKKTFMDSPAASTLPAADAVPADAVPASTRPTVPEVRGQVPLEVRGRSTTRGLLTFAIAAACYAATYWGILAAPCWPLQIGCAILNGMFIGMIFIVGHDACHQSLTPHEPLNHVLGRLAFLPSLTPFTSWEYAHNRIHHAYTNLRSRDYAWAPFSKAEYDALPFWRRWLERHYRSVLGLGTYYLLDYWIKHLLLPCRAERREMKKQLAFLGDLLLISAFATLQVLGVLAWSAAQESSPDFWGPIIHPAGLIVIALVVPFLLWNWFMSFAIFQHHNHPQVAWFDNKEEWDYFAAQVESTVHVQLPWFLEWITGHIMQHTAHHVDPKIPLYRLIASQRCLEAAYPRDIVLERWTVATLGWTLARCKLYDYENHRWLTFAGRPTTEPNPVLRALKEGSLPPRRK